MVVLLHGHNLAEAQWATVGENGSSMMVPRAVVYLKPTVKTNGKNEEGAWTIIDE